MVRANKIRHLDRDGAALAEIADPQFCEILSPHPVELGNEVGLFTIPPAPQE